MTWSREKQACLDTSEPPGISALLLLLLLRLDPKQPPGPTADALSLVVDNVGVLLCQRLESRRPHLRWCSTQILGSHDGLVPDLRPIVSSKSLFCCTACPEMIHRLWKWFDCVAKSARNDTTGFDKTKQEISSTTSASHFTTMRIDRLD